MAGPGRAFAGIAEFQHRKVLQAIHAAAGYLARAATPSGQFTYRINLDKNVILHPRYNMLRHSGTIYALATYERTYPRGAHRRVLARAVEYMKQNSIAPLPARNDLWAVWSMPEITGRNRPLQAKLGGTGLGLVALLSMEALQPGHTPLDDLRRMGRFLLYMQKADGSFSSKYIPTQGGFQDNWVSLYYPGEAALGLAMLYAHDPLPQWLQAATKALVSLASIREGQTDIPADHWALIATARILPLAATSTSPFPRQQLINHAIQICEAILDARAAHPQGTELFGCFTADGRTTPTAVRLEGLLAALTFISPRNDRLRQQIVNATTAGIDFLIRTQVQNGPHAGGIPRAAALLPPGHSGYSPNFNTRATEIRIDYVQHALSALLQYSALHHPQLSSSGRHPSPLGDCRRVG